MTSILYILIFTLNFYTVIKNEKSKKIEYFSFFVIFILFAGYGNVGYEFHHDLSSYIDVYNSVVVSNMEFGYNFLMKIGNFFGLSFYTFKSLTTIGCFSLILYSFKKHFEEIHMVLLLYISFSLFNDTERFRNFIAVSIVIFGIINYLLTEEKGHRIRFVITILIASTIHSSMIVYLLFLLLNRDDISKITNRVIIGTLIICIVLFLNGNQLPFTEELIHLIKHKKIRMYLSLSGTNWGFLIPFIIHSYTFTLVYFSRTSILKNTTFYELTSVERKYIDLIYYGNKLFFVFLPLTMIQLIFSRFFYSILLMDYIYFSIIYHKIIKTTDYRYLYLFLALAVPLLWTYTEYAIKLDVFRVLIPFFTENILIP